MFSGRLYIAVLVAAVAAFFVVPVAQAAANLQVNLAGTGKGEVKTQTFYDETEPVIECSGPPAAGTCTSPAGEEYNTLAAIPAQRTVQRSGLCRY